MALPDLFVPQSGDHDTQKAIAALIEHVKALGGEVIGDIEEHLALESTEAEPSQAAESPESTEASAPSTEEAAPEPVPTAPAEPSQAAE